MEKCLPAWIPILAGGGNTLNRKAIWKLQGMDHALRKAYEQGVLPGEGSAGLALYMITDRSG